MDYQSFVNCVEMPCCVLAVHKTEEGTCKEIRILYRSGGDEFIVIMDEITKEVFERKVEKLREDVEKNTEVSFAIDSFWSDGSRDIATAFRGADQIMYADKRAYYKRHPQARRR